jgi:hypothetical protein
LCFCFSFWSSGAILHAAHRAHLDHCQRQDRQAHDHRQHDDRPRPREPGDALDAEQQSVQGVLERREDAGEDDHRGITGSTGSWCEKGWQRLSRRSAISEPRSGPCMRIASSA